MDIKKMTQSARAILRGLNERYIWFTGLGTRALESLFHRYGLLVGKHPKITLLVSLVLFLSMAGGCLMWYENKNDDEMWTPIGSPYIKNEVWVEKNFPKDRRYETVLIYGKDVIRSDFVQFLYNLTEAVEELKSEPPESKNLTDLCVRINSKCLTLSILDIWSVDGHVSKEIIFNLTDADVRRDVAKRIEDEDKGLFPNSFMPTRQMFSNLRYVKDELTADAFKTIWLLKHEVTDPLHGSTKDENAIKWERKFIDLIIDNSGYHDGGNINTNGNRVPGGRPDGLQLEAMAEFSYDEGIHSALDSSMILMGVSICILLVYVVAVLGKYNVLEQRVLLSLCGVGIVGLACPTSFGISFYIGYSFSQMHETIPFLLLGIGVDDMFVMVQALDNLTPKERQLPIDERIALCLRHSGVSITVTTVTDMAAFLVSASTTMPVLRSFCIFSSLGILTLYIFALTFFVPCMIFDEKRMDARKVVNWSCCKSYSEDWQPNRFSRKQILKTLFGKHVPKVLFKTPVKFLVLIVTFSLVGVASFGASQLEADLEEIWYMDQYSYQTRFYSLLKKYFPHDGERVGVYLGQIPYWNNTRQLSKIVNIVDDNKYVADGSFKFWYREFSDICGHSCFENEDNFKRALFFSFFAKPEYSNYFDDFQFDPDLHNMTQEEITNIVFHNISEITILATRGFFQHSILESTTVQNEAMHSIMDDLKKVTFENADFKSPVVYNQMYVHWGATITLSKELFKNLVSTFVIIVIILFLFVPNIQIVVMTISCVLFTVVDVAGFSYFIGLTIENVTSIVLILSVGLAVDYCAHISVAYIDQMKQPSSSRDEKASGALEEIGAAIFNGGFSTFLAFVMVSFSQTYVFQTFFKMFSMVVLFGLFHGLVYLPVVLSILGPSYSSLNSPKERYENSNSNSALRTITAASNEEKHNSSREEETDPNGDKNAVFTYL